MNVPPDHPSDLPAEDVALLLAAVDGTLDDAQVTRLLADPVLQREADQHRAVHDALTRAVRPLPEAVRDRLVANALGAIGAPDEMGSSATPTPTFPSRSRRPPLARVGAVAAAAAATLAVLGGLSLLGGPGGLDTASDVPTTAAVTLAAEAERAANPAGIASADAADALAEDAVGKDAGAGPAPDAGEAATATDAPVPTRLPAPLSDLDSLRAATRDLLAAPPTGAARCTPAAGATRGVVLGTWQGTEAEILFVADAPGAPVTSLEVRDGACTLLASLPVG